MATPLTSRCFSYLRLSRAHEALGHKYEAQATIVRGLRHKELENHFGLADHLILMQTDGQGLQGFSDRFSFDAWERGILVEDEMSAVIMKDLGGAWKRRCDDRRKSLDS